MKKYTLLPLLSLILVACQPEGDLASKKARIGEIKTQISDLKGELAELQTYVEQNDPVALAAKKSNLAVRVKELQPEHFEYFFNTEGIVESEKDVLVSPQMQAQITQIVVEEGQWVKKGQLLARLNSGVIQNQRKELETRLELATTLFEKQRKLWKEQFIGSEIQYLEAKSNKEALEQALAALKEQSRLSVITSPINGVVDKIFYKQGAFASPQQPFAQVLNLKKLKVTAQISESYLSKIVIGDSVHIDFEDLGLTMVAPITRIGNSINPQSRTFEIDVEIGNVDGQIKPNALAKLRLKEYENKSALVLPSNVVQQDNNGHFIFTLDTSGEEVLARKKYVSAGKSNNKNQTIITGGVASGDRVIVDGYNLVTNGLPVQIVD